MASARRRAGRRAPGRGPSRAAVLALTCILPLACGGAGDPDGEAGRDPGADAPDAAAGAPDTAARGPGDAGGAGPAPGCEAFTERGLAVALPTRRAFRDAVGEPTAVTRTPVANRHVEGQTDTLVAFEAPGLVATYYVLPGRDLLSSVAVRDARWLRYSSPSIGTPRAELESLFGSPDALPGMEAGTLSYECSPSPAGGEPVHFELTDGVVKEIRFSKYVD